MFKEPKKIRSTIQLLLILTMLFCNCIQAQVWEGFGIGINYARIQNDTIIYEVGIVNQKGIDHHISKLICEDLKPGTNNCKVLDTSTLEYKYNMNVIIAQNRDTIFIYYPGTDPNFYFVKDEYTKDQIELIKQIEIEFYSASYKLKKRTILDFSGFIEVENFADESIIKIEISQKQMDAIRNSIEHLNFTQLNELTGRRNFTGHELETGFSFITEDNSKYSYIGVEVPGVFQTLLLNLQETEMRITER